MIKLDLQFFGGRGSLSGSTGTLGRGGGESINVKNTVDAWSFRHNPNNAPGVDAINTAARDMERDFPTLMNTVEHVNVSELGGSDASGTLGYYQPGTRTVALNERYTDIGRMNAAYDSGGDFHPSRGNKSGVQAVAYHELGHALTDHIAQKYGNGDLHDMSATIVQNAYKKSGLKGGNRALAAQISGYAHKNYAECVAEAVCDYYCNGSKASTASKLIMNELKSYN